jgi:hypothetical protein
MLPYGRRFVPLSCASLCAAGRRAPRMRPWCPSPRPLAGYRRRRSSIDGDPFFSIHLSLCSTGFHRLRRYYKRSDFCMGIGWSSLPPSSLPRRGPTQTSQGKNAGCTAAPVPTTAPTSVGFWASRSNARSPGRPGLLRASLSFGAAACLRLLPHTASRRQVGLSRDAPTCVQLPSACGCYQLAPQRTPTSYPASMPGTRSRPAAEPRNGR